MYGIAGIFMQNGARVADTDLEQAARSLAHRGPDSSGLFRHRSLGMAHTRLSIIDLTTGDQPLYAKNGKLVLIANGEIYNYIELRDHLLSRGHRFATQSDSEVILHAYLEYGDAFLSHLNGMFAFALYDTEAERLILARDRIGIKPLFIANWDHGIGFGSEIKALLKLNSHRPQVSPIALLRYLQFQFSAGRTTLFEGIERVQPGEAICIEKGHLKKRWRYWTALKVTPRAFTQAEAEDKFETLMNTVMQEHIRSDVPFGLFLSGGVDSALLLALLSRLGNEPIRTYSVGFKDSQLFDELPRAESLAKAFASRHHSIQPTSEEIFLSLPYTVWAADELMRDYASLPTAMLSEAAGRELKVVFSGEGGDEIFAGYRRYRTSILERWVKGLRAPGSGGFRTRGSLRRTWPDVLLKDDLRDLMPEVRKPFINAWRVTPAAWSDLQRMQYIDLTTALPDNLLVKLDRMLMGFSLEGRVPLLDHRVIEFGLALPDRLKIQGRQGKVFLKRWARRYLPPDHDFGPKRGFYVPISEWMTPSFLAELMRILPDHPALRPWCHAQGVAQLIGACHKSRANSQLVWSLLQYVIWHRVFIDGNGERPPIRTDPLTLIA